MFKRIFTGALFAGIATGLIAALLHVVFVEHILLHAELFESGVLKHVAEIGSASEVDVETDVMRNALTVLFSTLLYSGYGLLLVALMALASERGATITARTGILWGLAGFLTIQLIPAFSLPPELPGMSAADLTMRQIWWYGTLGATGVSIWLIAFGRSWTAWGAAVILIASPQIIGAPHPELYHGSVPPELATLFAGRTLGVGLVAWIILGLLSGYFWQRGATSANA